MAGGSFSRESEEEEEEEEAYTTRPARISFSPYAVSIKKEPRFTPRRVMTSTERFYPPAIGI